MTATVGQLLHGLRVGGAEVLAARLARRLAGAFRFVFYCLDELGTLGESLRGDGFPVAVIGRRPGLDRGCARRLGEASRRDGVSVLHAHQYTPFFYGMLARGFRPSPPILFTEHGRHFPDPRRPKRMAANRLLIRRRDRVAAVGGAVRDALVRNEGIPRRRIEVVYNGIDLSGYRGEGPDRAAVRREIGVEAGDFVVMQVARLDHLKDHATAVRAIERVVGQRPEAKLVLVGEGPEEGSIRALVRDRGLDAHVRLLGLRDDVPRLFRSADVGFLTSVSEGVPLTLIEAMAAALPTVATDVGGVGEVVEADRTGLLAPSGDDATLADHLLALAADPERAAGLGRLGRERAEAVFSEDRMVEGYERLYRAMADA